MRTRLFGGIVALTIALGAFAFPSATPARAASTTCTGWTSKLVPPTTIRVYRTATKRSVDVPFRQYVETVMAAEWGPTNPVAALRAGAVAAKQYGWYFAIYWRGGRDAAGRCYDVVDTWRDQVYDPARTVYDKHRAAVAATWGISLRKGTSFFLTGYRAGTGDCYANHDGWKLYQRDASDCVRDHGWTAERVARHFFSKVSWITPGAGDWSGDARGDLAVTSADPATGATTARVLTTDAAYEAAVAAGTLAGATVTTTAPDALVGRLAADVTGDGRQDLVQLVRTEQGATLEVIRGTAAGLQPAATWWREADDAVVVSDGELRLVAADFTGDGRDDAGILRLVGGETPSATLYLATSVAGRFLALRPTWSADIDLTAGRALAGDVDGDGLGDLVVLTPGESGGTDLRVALSDSSRDLGPLLPWATDFLPLDSLQVTLGDLNRDGRADVIVARRVAAGIRLVGYRTWASASGASRGFLTDPVALPFERVRFGTADQNADGRADVFALVDLGTDEAGAPLGTEIWRFRSTETGTLTPGAWQTIATLDWATAAAY